MSDELIQAPFTPGQVAALNHFQISGVWHPFTCPEGHDKEVMLVAFIQGWQCPRQDCDYTQLWAHEFMADPLWLSSMLRRWSA